MHKFGRELARSFNENYLNSPYFHWAKCFDDAMVGKIIKIGESLDTHEAKIGHSVEQSMMVPSIRTSTLSWIHHGPDTEEIYDTLIQKVDSVNYWHYGFALNSMDHIQYTRYPVGGHYMFHNDILPRKEDLMRKLSIVVCLTSATDYDGGELQISPSGGPTNTRIKLDKGDLIAFPSWTPHRVAPVTAGHRITAVAWIYGPKFV